MAAGAGMQSLVCVLISLFSFSFARIGFVKDQRIDNVEFPPRMLKKHGHGLPTGHLRPLGWQRPSSGKVAEEKGSLSPKEFYDTYVQDGKPVVFRNYMKDAPAMTKWAKDEYLRKQYGELYAHIVTKNQNIVTNGARRLQLKQFLREYNYEDWYLSNTIPQEMMVDVLLPDSLKCGFTNYLYESEIWMSSGGTSSLLHAHADHNLHCVLSGRKDFILIEEKYKGRFSFIDQEPHPGAGHSPFDMDQLNVYESPEVAETPWTWSTLLAGDCIFVPAKYLHQVRSMGRSFSSTILWAPSPDISFTECTNMDLSAPVILKEAPFIWTYTHGDRELSNIRLNGASLQHHLLVIMRDEPSLRYAVFRDFHAEIMSHTQGRAPAHELWSLLDPEKQRKLSRDTIKNMAMPVLEEVAKELNYAHSHATPKDEF